jgi:hypothetical protein
MQATCVDCVFLALALWGITPVVHPILDRLDNEASIYPTYFIRF